MVQSDTAEIRTSLHLEMSLTKLQFKIEIGRFNPPPTVAIIGE